jgi:hypothetical protein
MPRALVWINQPRFLGWGCSQCGWVFNAQGPPRGATINEMLRNYASLRDKEFAAHVCSKHPRKRKPTPTPDAT